MRCPPGPGHKPPAVCAISSTLPPTSRAAAPSCSAARACAPPTTAVSGRRHRHEPGAAHACAAACLAGHAGYQGQPPHRRCPADHAAEQYACHHRADADPNVGAPVLRGAQGRQAAPWRSAFGGTLQAAWMQGKAWRQGIRLPGRAPTKLPANSRRPASAQGDTGLPPARTSWQ